MHGPKARSSEGRAPTLTLNRVFALGREGLSWSQVCRILNVSKGSAPSESLLRLAEKEAEPTRPG